MRRIICSLLMLGSLTAAAQQKQELDLSNLKPPVSPGFTILDVSPAAIERPKTIREFTVSTTSLFDNGLSIPKNFAFEFAPGWMLNNKGYTFYQITGLNKVGKALKENVFSDAKFASLSIASVYNEDSVSTPTLAANSNHISYGAKVNLIKVYGKKRLALMNIFLEDAMDSTSAVLEDIDPDEPAAGQANALRAKTKAAWDKLKDLRSIRPLFQMQFAAASSLAFPDNKGGRHQRTGVWTNIGFSFPLTNLGKDATLESANAFLSNKNFINLIALARCTNASFDSLYLPDNRSVIDLGARAEFELDRLMIGVEYVYRNGNNDFVKTDRVAGMIEYRIWENLYVVGSFGRNFGEYNNVISMLGLNMGFGKQSAYTPFKLR
ncbi:hypothetical protein MKQ68_03350 [Chitinophaga horti]|uniref:Uncharacterized protein n=1 Tax=Chitinophaga horti TaxID=2920382 RepID=A0ABY6J779_9BACT|nr:hypothetical protein [Chitinophaga horti]UYQ94127.1 hypothetical protein MKQ68_03350 [Chitinophaga horti]